MIRSSSHETLYQQSRAKGLKDTAAFVKNEYNQVVRSSAFLQKKNKETALFHRTEIVTGAPLGLGGYSVVYEIRGFDLKRKISASLSPAQQAARKRIAAAAVINGKCRFAIKHLQPSLMENPTAFSRAAADLAIEGAFLSSLNHPNIISLQGWSVDGLNAFSDGTHDSFFLITERLTGTLEGKINEWRANPTNVAGLEERLNIAQQLADALNYLHERQLVFRDLKPANIGFSLYNDNKLKLFDFGLCRELPKDGKADDTFVMSGVGTFRYMAVEVSKGQPYNCKADVYGWSMILWQMLSLRTPFGEYSKDDYYLKVCKEGTRPMLSAHIPDSIQFLLRECWTKNISNRLHMKDIYNRIDEIKKDQLQIRMGKARQRLCSPSASHQVLVAV